MKPAGDRCLNQGESVERQAVGGRLVKVKYPREEAKLAFQKGTAATRVGRSQWQRSEELELRSPGL